MSQARYMFRVTGRLSEEAQHAVGDFGALEVTVAPPETIICGAVVDEAHLHGLLSLFRALGLGIVSMQQVPELSGESQQHFGKSSLAGDDRTG